MRARLLESNNLHEICAYEMADLGFDHFLDRVFHLEILEDEGLAPLLLLAAP
jgi:hypothetical protein